MLLMLPTNATGIAQKIIKVTTKPVVAANLPIRSGYEMRILPQIISAGLGARVRSNLKGMKPLPGILSWAAAWAAGRVVNVMKALLSCLFSVWEDCLETMSGFKRASSVRDHSIESTFH